MTLKKIISIKNIGRFINSAAPGNPELPTYTLMLGKCDGSALQNWRFENYRLSLKAHPDKCLTIGPEPSRAHAGRAQAPEPSHGALARPRHLLGRSARETTLAHGKTHGSHRRHHALQVKTTRGYHRLTQPIIG